jgi:hypothetical protein
VAAKTSLDVSRQELEIARAKTAEEKRAADETDKAIAVEQERLGWGEQRLAQLMELYRSKGRPVEMIVDIRTARERVDALKKQIEDLRKVAGAQAIALEVTQTAETKAETAVMRAEGGLKEAETRRAENQQDKRTKQQEDIAAQREAIAKATKAVEEISASASAAPVEVKVKITADLEAAQTALGEMKKKLASMEASLIPPPESNAQPAPAEIPVRNPERTIADLKQDSAEAVAKARADGKRKLEKDLAAARDEQNLRKKEADDQKEASKKDLDQSAQFRQFALSPRLRVEADRAEREANQKKERDERSYQNLLKRARVSGYRAVENAAGDFDVSRDPRVAGTRSKRLADAVRAEAERIKGEREKKDAEQLEKDALRAQVEAAALLAKIAHNTEQGPVV